MKIADLLRLFLLLSVLNFGTVANAQSGGIEVDADLGGGWSYSDVYGAFTELGSGWNYSDWFGYFYTQDGDWFWRPGFGWTYLWEGSSLGDWWMFVYDLQDWCWTSDDAYPFVSSVNIGNFIEFREDILSFYNSDTGEYFAGGVYTVDIVITNLSFDQASWNSIVNSTNNALSQTGFNNFFTYQSSADSIIFRYNFGSQTTANLVRNAVQPITINNGFYSITIQ